MILLIVSMLFGYLVIADVINKVVNYVYDVHPKVECIVSEVK